MGDADSQIARIIREFSCPDGTEATQQGISHRIGMTAHIPGILTGRAPRQNGNVLRINAAENAVIETNAPHPVQSCHDILYSLHTCSAWAAGQHGERGRGFPGHQQSVQIAFPLSG